MSWDIRSALKSVLSHAAPNANLEKRTLEAVLEAESDVWERAKRRAQGGKRILIATSMGCYEHAAIVESAIAVALSLRGADVSILLCDQLLPCCQMTKIYNVDPGDLLAQEHTPRCEKCDSMGRKTFKILGLPIIGFSQWIGLDDAANAQELSENIAYHDIANYVYMDVAVGEHAMAGALRFYARGDLNDEPLGERVLRRYLKSSLLTAMATGNLLDGIRYDSAVFNHGIYVPQGVIGEVLRREGVNVINWNPSYRKQTFIFSHDDSYHHTMITEPVSQWESMDWDVKREQSILEYLKSRWYGTQDWIWFHEKPYEDLDKIQAEVGVDFSKPCIGLLTSVMWDAQLHYKSNAFRSMSDWMLKTIEYFRDRPDLQLVARIHPAEVNGLIPSRQRMVDEIAQRIPDLPSNCFIVPPESHISTYALMQKCNAVIIYNTKTGIEISSMGIPVIVAGEAWIRGKGFSIDVTSPTEYFTVLDSLPLPSGLSAEHLSKARKYAYHFFFRRMLELPFIVTTKKHKFISELSTLKQLGHGNYPGLDVICNGILEGTPFFLDPK